MLGVVLYDFKRCFIRFKTQHEGGMRRIAPRGDLTSNSLSIGLVIFLYTHDYKTEKLPILQVL